MGNSKSYKKEKQGLLMRFLNVVERVGNKLPDPVTIFVILWFVVLILSYIVSKSGITAVHPGQIDEATGKNLVISGVNLLSKEQLQLFLGNIVTNFTSFAPLGLVLVTMLGAGLAEKSGLMETVMKSTVTKVPKRLLTATIIFVGILANAVADAGFVVLPPLAALVFLGVGRHPLVGLFAGYAGVAAGFSSNLMINMLDVLVSGFTIPAAQIVDPNYVGTPAMNWYFLIASTFILTALGTFITEKYLAPRFEGSNYISIGREETSKVTPLEKKAIKYAGLGFLICVIVLVALCIGPDAFMKDNETGSIHKATSTIKIGRAHV